MATIGKHATAVLEAQLSLAQLATMLQSPWPALLAAALSILSSTLTLASSPDRTIPRPAAALSVLPPTRGLCGWAAFLLAATLAVYRRRSATAVVRARQLATARLNAAGAQGLSSDFSPGGV